MEGLIDTLHLLAQPQEGSTTKSQNKQHPELLENQTVWKSNNQAYKEATFIQMGRRGGDAETGWRGEETWCG